MEILESIRKYLQENIMEYREVPGNKIKYQTIQEIKESCWKSRNTQKPAFFLNGKNHPKRKNTKTSRNMPKKYQENGRIIGNTGS